MQAVLFDESLEAGRPRPLYEPLLAELAELRLAGLATAAQADADAHGMRFDGNRFPFDPVPRLIDADEWSLVARGISQRLRALDAFLADAYGERAAVAAGVLPARVIEESAYYEPELRRHPTPPRVNVAGLDLIRGPDGRFRSLEDNVRTPSGLSFMQPAREIVLGRVGSGYDPLPLTGIDEALAATLRAADPSGHGDPSIALLSEGPAASAWFEHRRLARAIGLPLVTPGSLYVRAGRVRAWLGGRSREVGVLYRRTDQDRVGEHGNGFTPLGARLAGPLRNGTVTCVNSFGAGAADDKAVHVYTDALIRFYLGEEPVLETVPGYDLGEPGQLDEALARLDELVVKSRDGSGGDGVVIAGELDSDGLETLRARIREWPAAFVAQEKVPLSTHPTISGDELAPRHVDLRPFAIRSGERIDVIPGGFTRFAPKAGEMIVNTSRGGGGKDTWVL